jgi:Glycosyltransferase like family
MIAFGCSITEPEPYLRYAEPGIRLAAETESEIYAFAAVGTIGRSYNLLLEHAQGREDLEALVLVHPYAEITDPDLCAKARMALSDPDVGVVGAVGATGVRTIAWWEGHVVSGPVMHRYQEYGGGELPAFSWTQRKPPPAEVEMVDGWLLVLSPWVVHNVRFDESLTLGHGFDLDYCLEVRRAGRKVMVHDLRLTHHHQLEPVSDLALWVEAHVRMAEKWDCRMPGALAEQNGDWRARARRAEAEREASRAIANSKKYRYDARLKPLEDAIEELTWSRSWRLTKPLRRANEWRRDRRDRAARA